VVKGLLEAYSSRAAMMRRSQDLLRGFALPVRWRREWREEERRMAIGWAGG
jgi:hypothetical protein